MSTTWRRFIGLDAFDLVVHGLITGVVLFWIAATNNRPDMQVLSSAAIIGSLVALDIRRRRALKRLGRSAESEELADARIAELEQRVAELESAHLRVAELEERLDFAERLLAAPKDPVRELSP